MTTSEIPHTLQRNSSEPVLGDFQFRLDGQPFSLHETFGCGQAFRWRENPDGTFSGVVHGCLATASVVRDELHIGVQAGKVPEREYWRRYFALDTDYRSLQGAFSKDATLAKCVAFAPGIRVLRQDFFEMLVTFIVSQNNNIPRIGKIIEGLCDAFGEELGAGPDGIVRHAFPTAEKIASLTPDDLAPLRAGYRVPFILAASEAFAGNGGKIESLRAMDTASARAELLKLHGVGPKVADCVLLFGMGRFESFPVDVWIRRAMGELFPNGLPDCASAFAGIAQQYIFNYARAVKVGG